MSKLNEDERFRHVSYHHTDIRQTFARERKRLAALKAQQDVADEEVKTKVRTIKAKSK